MPAMGAAFPRAGGAVCRTLDIAAIRLGIVVEDHPIATAGAGAAALLPVGIPLDARHDVPLGAEVVALLT